MSWNSPTNWSEVVNSIESRWDFNARRLGVAGHNIFVMSNIHLSGWLDDFGREVIASNTRVRDAYMAHGRGSAYGPDDFVYIVTRDGNAIAGVTYSGDIKINPAVATAGKRYKDALARILPPLGNPKYPYGDWEIF